MKNAITLAPRLALARLRGAQGGAILDAFAVVAFTVATFLALTVAGGTAMFIKWNSDGNPQMVAHFAAEGDSQVSSLTSTYVVFAALACAMLVVPILSLGGAAARLGAKGRSTRLASLRLVGMTGSEVVAISIIETMVQAVLGMMIGTLAWVVSLPLWHPVTFQTVHLTPSLMRGPWWMWLAVWAVMMVLAVLSTIIGLRRVRISPLGVAARQTPPAIRSWRLWVLVVVAVTAVWFIFRPTKAGLGQAMLVAVIAGFVAALMLVINLAGPWVIQLIARVRTRTGSVSTLLASRRLVDDPKAAWRNVSALAVVGFVGSFAILIPVESAAAEGMDGPGITLMSDLRTGAIITLVITFVVGAVSTLIAQSSSVIDRAEESRSMDRMGVPRSIYGKMRRQQVFLPLVVTLTVSLGLGLVLTVPFLQMGSVTLWPLAVVVVLGIGLTLLAAQACAPVQTAVLNQGQRRND